MGEGLLKFVLVVSGQVFTIGMAFAGSTEGVTTGKAFVII